MKREEHDISHSSRTMKLDKSDGEVGVPHGNGDATASLQDFSYAISNFAPPWRSSTHDLRTTFSWDAIMAGSEFVAAPVATFKHAPISDIWCDVHEGVMVEVENKDVSPVNGPSPCYWVATVKRICGYRFLVRFEGFDDEDKKDFWVNIGSGKLRQVGWCSTTGHALLPSKGLLSKYPSLKDPETLKDFLRSRMNGFGTICATFLTYLMSDCATSSFKPGMKLEVVDKMRICQMRVASIIEVTGRRLYLKYDDVDHDDNGFWCHEQSPLIHAAGWSRRVGHQIEASDDYNGRCTTNGFNSNYCSPDMFSEYPQPPGTFSVGMKIEAVDPLNLATVCAATVMKVLKFGYIMIRIDGYENDETGSDWFCYHASSPLIFAPGFCKENNIRLKAPTPDWEGIFSWSEYLKESQAVAAHSSLFLPREEAKHSFKVGMKVEAVDQMDPRLVCVSTISRVVGRLLKVHFDGWEDEYDQWMDCDSVDIYPVGWAELVGHKLESPKQQPPAKREKRKPGPGRKGKKRTSAGSSSSANTSGSNNGRGRSRRLISPASTTSSGHSPASLAASANVLSPAQASALTSASAVLPSSPSPAETPPPVLEPQVALPAAAFKLIPRLVDTEGQDSIERHHSHWGRDTVDPATWSVDDLAQFLQINDCASHVDGFVEHGIDGARFLEMDAAAIARMVNGRIGPKVKIKHLQERLKVRIHTQNALEKA